MEMRHIVAGGGKGYGICVTITHSVRKSLSDSPLIQKRTEVQKFQNEYLRFSNATETNVLKNKCLCKYFVWK